MSLPAFPPLKSGANRACCLLVLGGHCEGCLWPTALPQRWVHCGGRPAEQLLSTSPRKWLSCWYQVLFKWQSLLRGTLSTLSFDLEVFSSIFSHFNMTTFWKFLIFKIVTHIVFCLFFFFLVPRALNTCIYKGNMASVDSPVSRFACGTSV